MRTAHLVSSLALAGALGAAGFALSAPGSSAARPAAKTATLDLPASVVSELEKLPLGDGKVSTNGPQRGYVYACHSANANQGGATGIDPWIHGDTFDLLAKAKVEGSVIWPNATFSVTKAGNVVKFTGNLLPVNTSTGTFPISVNDPAHQYDGNPNQIGAHSYTLALPSNPQPARAVSCLPGGAIGIAKNGVAIFSALDAGNRDAVAHEVQDSNGGHPDVSEVYHYHSLPIAWTLSRSYQPIGWALDGYPIYPAYDSKGHLVTNTQLDACHGRVEYFRTGLHRVARYVYHATLTFPYTIGCFHGSPVSAQLGERLGAGGPGPGAAAGA